MCCRVTCAVLVSLQYNRGKGLGPNGCRLVQVQYQKPTREKKEEDVKDRVGTVLNAKNIEIKRLQSD